MEATFSLVYHPIREKASRENIKMTFFLFAEHCNTLRGNIAPAVYPMYEPTALVQENAVRNSMRKTFCLQFYRCAVK